MIGILIGEVRELAAVAREFGMTRVKYMNGGSFLEIELGPLPRASAVDPAPSSGLPAGVAPDHCRCGHPNYDHNVTGCMHGCQEALCVNIADEGIPHGA